MCDANPSLHNGARSPDSRKRARRSAAPSPAPSEPLRARLEALLVACSYVGTDAELRGCFNDSVLVSQRLLKDDALDGPAIGLGEVAWLNECGAREPILANIQHELTRLLGRTRLALMPVDQGGCGAPAVLALVHMSGHGCQVRDVEGEEADGMDEVFLPLDFKRGRLLRDDDVNRDFAARVPAGAVALWFQDSCHSGGPIDLAFTLVLGAEHDDSEWDDARPARWVRGDATHGGGVRAVEAPPVDGLGTVVAIGMCRNHQTSADSYFSAARKWNGAGTRALVEDVLCELAREEPRHQKSPLDALLDTPLATLLRRLRSALRRKGFDQVPQLTCNRQLGDPEACTLRDALRQEEEARRCVLGGAGV